MNGASQEQLIKGNTACNKSKPLSLLLQKFLTAIADDHRIHPTHISLYVALLHYWKQQNYMSPIALGRDEGMRLSKITGRTTYQKCMRDLHYSGYIIYRPSFNRFKKSEVELIQDST
jgi:hypothetical protein